MNSKNQHPCLIILFLLFLGIITANEKVHAQSTARDAKGHRYKITETDTNPANVGKLLVGISPFGADIGLGFFMGYEGDIRLFPTNKIQLQASAFSTYTKTIDSEYDAWQHLKYERGITRFQYLNYEFGSTFYLLNGEIERETGTLFLRQYQNDNAELVNVWLIVDVPQIRRWGLRLGAGYFQQTTGPNLKFKSMTDPKFNLGIRHIATNVNYMYLGISSSVFRRLQAQVEGSGYSSNTTINNLYMDGFWGLSTNSYYFDQSGPATLDSVPSFKRSGIRFGYERIALATKVKGLALNLGAEMAWRPFSRFTSSRHNISKPDKVYTISPFYFGFKMVFYVAPKW
jgi:hypothetical protein